MYLLQIVAENFVRLNTSSKLNGLKLLVYYAKNENASLDKHPNTRMFPKMNFMTNSSLMFRHA